MTPDDFIEDELSTIYESLSDVDDDATADAAQPTSEVDISFEPVVSDDETEPFEPSAVQPTDASDTDAVVASAEEEPVGEVAGEAIEAAVETDKAAETEDVEPEDVEPEDVEPEVAEETADLAESATPDAEAETLVVEADAENADAEAEEAPDLRVKVSWWPFVLYAMLWAGLAAAVYFVLRGPEADIPAFRQDAYPFLLLGGLVLTLCGPLLSLFVWFLTWRKAEPIDRGGLLTRAMMRGAVITFIGVGLWYGALNLVDVIRLGWI